MSKADKSKSAKNYSLDSLPKEFLHPKYWPIWVGIAFIRLLAFMPYPVVMSIAKGFGLVAFHLAKSRKKVVDINLAACFPEKSRRLRVARWILVLRNQRARNGATQPWGGS